MAPSRSSPALPARLRSAVVLHVDEEHCEVLAGRSTELVGYAPPFPTPRVDRVSPGHRVAIAEAPVARPVVLWRWYDAVVVGHEGDLVRIWEPAHGEVLATPREGSCSYPLGTRAWASAGLPGADWWLAGPAAGPASEPLDLDEVARFYTRYDLWESALAPVS